MNKWLKKEYSGEIKWEKTIPQNQSLQIHLLPFFPVGVAAGALPVPFLRHLCQTTTASPTQLPTRATLPWRCAIGLDWVKNTTRKKTLVREWVCYLKWIKNGLKIVWVIIIKKKCEITWWCRWLGKYFQNTRTNVSVFHCVHPWNKQQKAFTVVIKNVQPYPV